MTHKILVVDDEENMQVLLKRVLGKAGYDVECAGSGAAALRLAADRPFDLAVVDVCMPEMDGIGVLEKLKGINTQIPVIMISAYPAWDKKQIAARMGCTDYLSKPVDMKYLKELIKGSLKNNLAFLHPNFTISLIDLQSQKSSK